MNNLEILTLINSIEVIESSSNGVEMEYIIVADNIKNRNILLNFMTTKGINEECCFAGDEMDLINVGFKYADWFEEGKGFYNK